jgi:hypothetical protein
MGHAFEQQLDDSLVPVPSRPPQRRPTVFVTLASLDLASLEQQLDDGLVPVLLTFIDPCTEYALQLSHLISGFCI